MAEGSLASAVLLPDQDTENPVPSPDSGLKRRQSTTTEHEDEHDPEAKRRRLSVQNGEEHPESVPSPEGRRQSSPNAKANVNANAEEKESERRRKRRDEERKRGQRLFGSLLGTLSQSSNSAAQRRRADIERKQQDKLKLQDEEYGELKKKRREERLALRKKEQKVYERELMHTRHENLLAMAHFLKTKSEPVLYYKPWQLRSEEEDIIRDQIREAEATIAREVDEFEARNAAREEEEPEGEKQDLPLERSDQAPASTEDLPEVPSTEQQPDTGAVATNHDKDSAEPKPESAPPAGNEVSAGQDQSDVHRDDDGGEVVEDNEDTVIY